MEVGVPNSLTGRNPDTIKLVVTGTGFDKGAVVSWDHKPLATHFVGPTRLTATVPFG